MKTIGLVGGTSWISTLDYYRLFNEGVNSRRGGNEAAKIALYSVNYGEIKDLTQANRWDAIADIICDAARKVERAGGECLLLGANTMHNIAPQVQAAVNIPLIHIADTTAAAIKKASLTTVALLGTKYTMQLPFYRDKLAVHGIETILPDGVGVELINDSIYNELGKGVFLPETKAAYLQLFEKLAAKGAQGIILGCTEIPLLIKQEDTAIPVFDTTFLHAQAAVSFALSE
ncbi:MAG: aspartate/glutamate racemase family protein [Flaviaesturariibacter sp.]|nr:aspartate/glutamate racemase family protein [Flaviaesturariibacter sp.]